MAPNSNNPTSCSIITLLHLNIRSLKKRDFIQITNLICVTYGPPNCPVSCLEELLKPNFTIALTFNKPIIVLGDLNCTLLQSCPENKALVNFISDLNLKQLITLPTRITDTCSSLIDVLVVSTSDLVHESGIITHTISDHLSVNAMLKLKRPKLHLVTLQ